jgi:hypothetical protein
MKFIKFSTTDSSFYLSLLICFYFLYLFFYLIEYKILITAIQCYCIIYINLIIYNDDFQTIQVKIDGLRTCFLSRFLEEIILFISVGCIEGISNAVQLSSVSPLEANNAGIMIVIVGGGVGVIVVVSSIINMIIVISVITVVVIVNITITIISIMQ